MRLCYHISGADDPIIRFKGPLGPLKLPCRLEVRRTSILTLIFDISLVYGPIWLCFEYDAALGLSVWVSIISLRLIAL